MELFRQFAGVICILILCKLLYQLALLIGSKAKFYERFLNGVETFKEQKKI